MARGKGRPFQKGNVANPGGRPKVDPIIAKFKQTTYADFIDTLQRYGSYTIPEMRAIQDDPSTTMFQRIFGTVIVKAAEGDKDARRELFERLWGKVKEEVQHHGINDAPMVTISLPAKKALEE